MKIYFKFAYIFKFIIQKLEYNIPLTDLEKRFLYIVDEYDFLIEEYEEYLMKKGD